MRIDRFGDDYDTAYEFPQNMMEDSLVISRPAVYARVGGLSGAFDYDGDLSAPYAPCTLRKRFQLQAGGDHAAVETLINELRAATINLEVESTLWLLTRNSTQISAFAKCTSLDVSESSKSYFALMVTIEFFCREGLWSGYPWVN